MKWSRTMSYHLIIGDKLYSSWSLRGALALELAGAPYEETLIKLNQPDTRQRLLAFSATGKVPLLKTEHGVIADSWPSPNTSTNSTPKPALARGRRRPCPGAFGLRADAQRLLRPARQHAVRPVPRPGAGVPLDVQVDIDRIVALWSECRVVAKDSGPFLFGRPTLADAFFAPVAVRLRTYRVGAGRSGGLHRNHLPMAGLPGLAAGRPGGA
jgi:glutathione S-transferase